MSGNIQVSCLALAKMVFHSSRWSHSAINGVMIGHDKGNNEMEITDVIPLFHNQLALAPMLTVALSQVRIFVPINLFN